MRVGGNRWKLVGVDGSEGKGARESGSGWEHGFVKPIIKYAWTYLGKIKRPNNN